MGIPPSCILVPACSPRSSRTHAVPTHLSLLHRWRGQAQRSSVRIQPDSAEMQHSKSICLLAYWCALWRDFKHIGPTARRAAPYQGLPPLPHPKWATHPIHCAQFKIHWVLGVRVGGHIFNTQRTFPVVLLHESSVLQDAIEAVAWCLPFSRSSIQRRETGQAPPPLPPCLFHWGVSEP